MYTSKEFSKKLKEAGCKLKSNYIYFGKYFYTKIGAYWYMENEDLIDYVSDEYVQECDDKIYSYDILNDLCVKYANELFHDYKICKTIFSMMIGEGIVEFTQDNIEELIWRNCKFNKECTTGVYFKKDIEYDIEMELNQPITNIVEF